MIEWVKRIDKMTETLALGWTEPSKSLSKGYILLLRKVDCECLRCVPLPLDLFKCKFTCTR